MLNNPEYKSTIVDGRTVLIRYHDKHKMKVKIYFSDNDMGTAQFVTDMLGNQYIENQVEMAV